ncbi:MAG: hypothetical protein K2X81_16440 [Candidatus Obscuribacterales bacterium]|nr:hypothetical protein [Candidatus Obscuribacterales bacterium]
MKKFTMMVTETYTNTFEVEAKDTDQAIELAEAMAIKRNFPSEHVETCNRTIAVSEKE